MLKKLFLTYS